MKIIYATEEEFIKDGKNNRSRFDMNSYSFSGNLNYHDKCNECGENCIHKTYIICQECQKRTCYGCIIDIDGNIDSYFCNKCRIYFNICYKCVTPEQGNLMRLISHYDGNYNDTNDASHDEKNDASDDEKNDASEDEKNDASNDEKNDASNDEKNDASNDEKNDDTNNASKDEIEEINYKIVKCSTFDYIDGCKSRIVYTKPIYFYDESKFGDITGPDGGYTSTWFCENCHFQVEMNDLS